MVRKPSIFSLEEWRTVPFAQNPKTAFDAIVDVLISIPDYSSLLHDSKQAEDSSGSTYKIEAKIDTTSDKVLQLFFQLDDWYSQDGRNYPTAHIATSEAIKYRKNSRALYLRLSIRTVSLRVQLEYTTRLTLSCVQFSQQTLPPPKINHCSIEIEHFFTLPLF